MFNIGDKLTKENYTQGAIWCNSHNATIEKQENKYVIVAIPEKTLEEKAEEKRAERNAMLVQEVDPLQLVIRWESLSDEEKQDLKDYRTYLLEIPNAPDFPETYILTFEEWKAATETVKENLTVEDVTENDLGDIETTSEKLKLD